MNVEELWQLSRFQPNAAQREAILYTDGPLYLTAGPGSGKTRVLLWRTLNLIVFHDAPPGWKRHWTRKTRGRIIKGQSWF